MYKLNDIVKTYFGKAKIVGFTKDNSGVIVEHIEVDCNVFSFYFDEIQLLK